MAIQSASAPKNARAKPDFVAGQDSRGTALFDSTYDSEVERFMNIPLENDDLEVITRFLRRFADLMSAGSNAENLLLAATLLEMNVKRANEAEEQLRVERSMRANLESQLATLSRDARVVPNSILRLVASQFGSMARTFERSGDIVSQAMCEASSTTLSRFLEADAPGAIAIVA